MTKEEKALKLLGKKNLTKQEKFMLENLYDENKDKLYICELGTLAVKKNCK